MQPLRESQEGGVGEGAGLGNGRGRGERWRGSIKEKKMIGRVKSTLLAVNHEGSHFLLGGGVEFIFYALNPPSHHLPPRLGSTPLQFRSNAFLELSCAKHN